MLLAGVLAVTACAPASAPSPTAAPAKAAQTTAAQAAKAEPKATEKPAQQATAKPAEAAKPSTGAPADWEKQWNDILAAAKKEGKVVVYGPPTPELRTILPAAFKQRFGIDMEYTGLGGGETAARLTNERAAGVYAVDITITGSDTITSSIAAEGKVTNGTMGMLVPLRPAMLLPEVVDGSKYRTGKLWFADPQEQYILRMLYFVQPAVQFNTQQVKPTAVVSWKDLLKPEYRGKLASFDPTIAGAGNSLASYLYATFGGDFVVQLYKDQEPFLSRDHRQLGDLLARGSHPITLALQPQEIGRLQSDGLPVATLPGFPDGPGYSSGGFGLMGMLDKAPHPNAAKVFANWIASKEGAQLFQDAQRQMSARNDVDIKSFSDADIPKAGVKYVDTYEWNYVLTTRPKVQDALKELLGRR